MCGMVGYSGVDNFDADKIKQLMLANMMRGVHSTGMYNDGKISKLADNAIEFLAENEIIPDKIFMGHDRHATIGNKSSVDNAHPFEYGTIIGQHNGTLKNHWQLCRSEELEHKDFDVDSQVLIALINKDKGGLKVLQEFEGAAAVIWHDKEIPNRIYCFRNFERPLYRGMIDDNMYISSIEKSLEMIGCKKIQEFKENFAYAIENGKIVLESSKRVHKKPIVEKKSYTQNDNYYGSLYSGNDNPSEQTDLDKLNLMSFWVQYTGDGKKSKFNPGEWVMVVSESKESLIIKESANITVTSHKKNFSLYEKLNVNGYVVVLEGDDKFFETGELLYLRGLELSESKKVTNAVLEKIEESESTYTWNTKYVRNATQKEIDESMFKGKSTLNGEDDDSLSDEEKKIFDFEENKEHYDVENNRLGSLWVEVGSSYESLITIRENLYKIGEELSEIVDLGDLKPMIKDSLNELQTSIAETCDISENETEMMFDRLFELYKS